MTYPKILTIIIYIVAFASTTSSIAQGFEGYYQYPDIHNDQLVFCAEGDIWNVSIDGGNAHRLTTHPKMNYIQPYLQMVRLYFSLPAMKGRQNCIPCP